MGNILVSAIAIVTSLQQQPGTTQTLVDKNESTDQKKPDTVDTEAEIMGQPPLEGIL